jgi:membrane protein implicated in regulation of membrane protease activity
MEKKKPNWFVRTLIILLCLFIGGLVYFNFFWSCPPAQISTGLLVLVAILTVLVLSEAFDNFSITKLISLSRTVNETENKNQELKKENSELRNQIVSISTSISQKQINSTFVLTDELAKMLSVKQADEPEKQQKQKETEQEAEQDTTTITTTTEPLTQEQSTKRYINIRRYEEVALPKFLASEGLSQLPIISDAKFTNQFQQIDPVSEFSPIFDGYIKTIDTEIFIELKFKNRGMVMLRERLYIMLSKIYYYRNIKRVNAYLFLVLIIRPDEEHNEAILERIRKEFEPSITNGLLRIREVEITNEENQQIINN